MSLTPFDLVSTPVPVLGTTDLVTHVGISGDDPLASRFLTETFRVFVTLYDRSGLMVQRTEVDSIGPGDRRLIPVSELASEAGVEGDTLAVVHRVPASRWPQGVDPDGIGVGDLTQSNYHLYRSMLQLSRSEGGQGSVVYETPPSLNDRRVRPKLSSALMFTSKVLIGSRAETDVCVMHHSLDPSYASSARVRLRMFDADGRPVAQTELELGAFMVRRIPLRALLNAAGHTIHGPAQGYSVVAWSRDAALLFLVIQMADEGRLVAVEHTHPPQTYLVPRDPAVRFKMKDDAIARWDAAYAELSDVVVGH